MTVTIQPVRNRRDLKKFIAFPFKIYRKNPFWVPPLRKGLLATLDRQKNPTFETCDAELWLAYQNGEIVGRIAGIINHRLNNSTGTRQARFGWIDFIEDIKVCAELLRTVEKWGRRHHCESLHGPLGFNDLDPSGMLVEGFDEPGTMATIYNHAYYPEYLERLGFQKEVDWLEYQIVAPREIPPQIDQFADRIARQNGLQMINLKSRSDILQYAREVFDLFQETYKVLYGFVPLSAGQVDDVVTKYFTYIQPDFVALVADEGGNLVAFGITMPSLTKALQRSKGRLLPFGWWHFYRALKRCRVVDFYLIGVKPELQGKGVPALILNHLGHKFLEKGILYAESNPELEDNRRVQSQWKFFERRRHKRRRCYVKSLVQEGQI